jgi:hypothetical protein
MTDITIARRIVAEPDFTDYRFGLSSVLTLRPDTDHWHQGVTWLSSSCGDAHITAWDCAYPLDPPAGAKTFDPDCLPVGNAAPFVVYTTAADAVADMAPAARRDFLVQQLERSEWPTIENALMTELAVQADVIAPLTSAALALGMVEEQIAQRYGGEGVIWTSRLGATLLAENGHLVRSGSRLETVLGTPVVAGRYDVDAIDVAAPAGPLLPPAAFHIFGTGALLGYRGPINVQDAIDRRVNRYASVAERTYVIGWDCQPVQASVTLTAAP